jgi:site-specific DNA-cytosine methylase
VVETLGGGALQRGAAAVGAGGQGQAGAAAAAGVPRGRENAGAAVILYTDIDPFCCEVLAARVADGGLPAGEVLRADIAALAGGRLRRRLRRYTQVHLFCGIGASPLGFRWAGWPEGWPLLTGGFPCQDISAAGRGAGLDGARSGLFWEMLRAIRVFRAQWADRESWVLAENVGALSARGLDRVVGALGAVGYEVHALRLGAWAVGAPHERERWWIVAHAHGDGEQQPGARRGRSGRAPEEGHHLPRRGGGQRILEDTEAVRCARGHGGAGVGGRQTGETQERGRQKDRRPLQPGAADTAGRTVGHAYRAGLEGDQCQQRDDGGELQTTLRAGGHVDAMADTAGSGQGAVGFVQARAIADFPNPQRWPHAYLNGPTPQHGWEAARLYQRAVGRAVDGFPGRLAGYLNKCGVAALGNAQVPQCVEVIARAMIEAGVAGAARPCAVET